MCSLGGVGVEVIDWLALVRANPTVQAVLKTVPVNSARLSPQSALVERVTSHELITYLCWLFAIVVG